MLHWPSGAEEFALQLSPWDLGVLLALGSLHLCVAFPAWAVIPFFSQQVLKGQVCLPMIHQQKDSLPSLPLPYCFGCGLLFFEGTSHVSVKIKANTYN